MVTGVVPMRAVGLAQRIRLDLCLAIVFGGVFLVNGSDIRWFTCWGLRLAVLLILFHVLFVLSWLVLCETAAISRLLQQTVWEPSLDISNRTPLLTLYIQLAPPDCLQRYLRSSSVFDLSWVACMQE